MISPQGPKPDAAPSGIDQKDWETKVRRLSAEFNKYPLVYRSGIFLTSSLQQHNFVSSEKKDFGAKVRFE